MSDAAASLGRRVEPVLLDPAVLDFEIDQLGADQELTWALAGLHGSLSVWAYGWRQLLRGQEILAVAGAAGPDTRAHAHALVDDGSAALAEAGPRIFAGVERLTDLQARRRAAARTAATTTPIEDEEPE